MGDEKTAIAEKMDDGQTQRQGNGRGRILLPGYGRARCSKMFLVLHRTGRLGAIRQTMGRTQKTCVGAQPAVQVH